MKKNWIIFLDLFIFIVVALNVILYVKKLPPYQKNTTPVSECGSPQSNDCLLKNLNLPTASGTLKINWEKLPITVENLPTNTWYSKGENMEKSELQLTIYPNIGKHYLLGSHDFGLILKINKSNRKVSKLSCIKRNPFDQESPEQNNIYTSGIFDIEFKDNVNYFYNGGPGTNPNPYTPEVAELLKKIHIKIGNC